MAAGGEERIERQPLDLRRHAAAIVCDPQFDMVGPCRTYSNVDRSIEPVELTDLAADGSQHVEQILIGLPDLAAEKLDHAQDFPPEQDGKAEGRVYSFALGDGSARKVFIRNDIGNVFGLKAGPHPAR